MVHIRTTRNVGSEASWRDAGAPDFQKSLISLGRGQRNIQIWNHVGPHGSTAMACRGATFNKNNEILREGSRNFTILGHVGPRGKPCRSLPWHKTIEFLREGSWKSSNFGPRGLPRQAVAQKLKKCVSPEIKFHCALLTKMIPLCVPSKEDSTVRSF